MSKKVTTQLAIVKAKADSLPVLTGMDTRVMEDMITVVIHEEIEALIKQRSEMERSLRVLEDGGKPDIKMANIIIGYYAFTGMKTDNKVVVKIFCEDIKRSRTRFDRCPLNYLSLVISKGFGKIGRVEVENVNNHRECETAEEYITQAVTIIREEGGYHNRAYLPDLMNAPAWAFYASTLSKADKSFIQEYIVSMVNGRQSNLESCNKTIRECNDKINTLNRKKNEVGVIAARIRVEDSPANAKDMALVKKFLEI